MRLSNVGLACGYVIDRAESAGRSRSSAEIRITFERAEPPPSTTIRICGTYGINGACIDGHRDTRGRWVILARFNAVRLREYCERYGACQAEGAEIHPEDLPPVFGPAGPARSGWFISLQQREVHYAENVVGYYEVCALGRRARYIGPDLFGTREAAAEVLVERLASQRAGVQAQLDELDLAIARLRGVELAPALGGRACVGQP